MARPKRTPLPGSTPREQLRNKVLRDIETERQAQDAKWGGPDHDDEHDTEDWCMYIRKFVKRAEYDADELGSRGRQHLIRIAALAVAAIESIDRTEAAKV